MSDFETVIGLEVHCQLDLDSKLFSDAPAAFGGEPNSRVSPVDMGLPGILPVVNRQALRMAVRAAVALQATIHRHTKFDRKNYFYPDLPKGYQISQFEHPYCTGGRVPIGEGRYCRLERIHLEEDAGKTIHTEHGSLVDLNRAGVALIELVGMPDLRSPVDAHRFLDALKQILQYAEISDCDMEKGSLRCDANISLRPRGSTDLGTKVEIKNLNSFKHVQRSLEYEERRQAAVLAAGGTVQQETRLWNEEKGETLTMRTKESAHDYRYFPEPDLPPLEIADEFVKEVQDTLPELPIDRRARFADQYELPDYDLDVLLAQRKIADYFEEVVEETGDAKAASNWIMTEVMRTLNETDCAINDFSISPTALAELLTAMTKGVVNRQAGRKAFARMLESGEAAGDAIAALGLEQISDPQILRGIVGTVVDDNPQPVADYRAGKLKALHALKGLVMKETRGKAHPGLVEEILLDLLGDG